MRARNILGVDPDFVHFGARHRHMLVGAAAGALLAGARHELDVAALVRLGRRHDHVLVQVVQRDGLGRQQLAGPVRPALRDAALLDELVHHKELAHRDAALRGLVDLADAVRHRAAVLLQGVHRPARGCVELAEQAGKLPAGSIIGLAEADDEVLGAAEELEPIHRDDHLDIVSA